MLDARLRELNAKDSTPYQLHDNVMAYLNVLSLLPAHVVFCHRDCPLAVFGQANCLPNKPCQQEIQHGFREERGFHPLR